MARRPEIPAAFGNWGLILRLNVANAQFCKDWYQDVMQVPLSTEEVPERLAQLVRAYVDRNSGDDRKVGALVNELKMIGVHCSEFVDVDASGQPKNAAAREALKGVYKKHLFDRVAICVMCTDTLLLQNSQNFAFRKGAGGFETMEPKIGYRNPTASLADLFGAEDAITVLRDLPLKRLTPAYDVVAMMLVVSGLEGQGAAALGLEVQDADDSMGLALLSEEERKLSSYPILMVPQQLDAAVDVQVRRLSQS